VTVTLTDSSNHTTQTTTASDGTYSFTGLAVGTYTISVPGIVSAETLETPNSLTPTISPTTPNAPNENFGSVAPQST
jgi:hypothetical protein